MNGPDALRWAADQIIGDDRVFDSDHDNALVAARLTELADRIETVDRSHIFAVLEDVLLDFDPGGFADDDQVNGYIDQLAKAFGITRES